MLPKKIFLSSDHGGVALKSFLKVRLGEKYPNLPVSDLGPQTESSVDYPDFASQVAQRVAVGEGVGVLVCGSGIGMSIAANKHKGIRAALVWDATSARLSKEHNHANILCLGARLVGPEVAWDALEAWLTATFQGGRHQGRVDKISLLEN